MNPRSLRASLNSILDSLLVQEETSFGLIRYKNYTMLIYASAMVRRFVTNIAHVAARCYG